MNTQICNEVCQFLNGMGFAYMEDIKPESLLGDDLGADSLDMIEVVAHFASWYDIHIPNSDYTSIKTVAEFVNMIDGKVNDKK